VKTTLAGLLVLTAAVAGADWKAPPEEKARPNPVSSTPEALKKGKFLYQKNCARCHGPKGKGDGPDAKSGPSDPEDLTEADLQKELTDGEMFWKITKGRKEGKEVIMPAFEREISSAEDRWRVVLFVRTLGEPPSKPAK
jgi:mono/diheme cytochrome c family protein